MTTRISDSDLAFRVMQILARIQSAGERFVVEQRGEPVAAVVSLQDLARLESFNEAKDEGPQAKWAALEMADQSRELILAERKGIPLTDSVELIHELREARDNDLSNLY